MKNKSFMTQLTIVIILILSGSMSWASNSQKWLGVGMTPHMLRSGGVSPGQPSIDILGTEWSSYEGSGGSVRSLWYRTGSSSNKWNVIFDNGTKCIATVYLSSKSVNIVSNAISGTYKGSKYSYWGTFVGDKFISGQRIWRYKGKSIQGKWTATIYKR